MTQHHPDKVFTGEQKTKPLIQVAVIEDRVVNGPVSVSIVAYAGRCIANIPLLRIVPVLYFDTVRLRECFKGNR